LRLTDRLHWSVQGHADVAALGCREMSGHIRALLISDLILPLTGFIGMRTKSACYFAFAMQSTRQTRLTTRKRSKLSRHAFEGGLKNSFENHTSSAADSRLSWNRVEGSWYSANSVKEVNKCCI